MGRELQAVNHNQRLADLTLTVVHWLPFVFRQIWRSRSPIPESGISIFAQQPMQYFHAILSGQRFDPRLFLPNQNTNS